MADEKLYTIESIDTDGPSTVELNLDGAIDRLNKEKSNGRMIFVDGTPVMDDVITEDSLSKYKKNISIVNQLIGG